MENQLPDDVQIAFATGDRITGSNGVKYFNFFNINLRWLCGYNNEVVSEKILQLSNQLKTNHKEFSNIFKQVNNIFLSNAGRKFRSTSFFSDLSVAILEDYYTAQNKFPVYLSDNPEYKRNEKYKNFLELFTLEKDSRKENRTKEGFSVKQIKNFFKHYKKNLSFFILSPVLFEYGTIISKETAQLFSSLCKKYNIPFIWDESLTCFYRTGPFYLMNQYNLEPDFISIDTNIYQKKAAHILIASKHINRKLKKELNKEPKKKEAANLILILSLYRFINEQEIQDYLSGISHRLKHKLLALSSNLKNRFSLTNIGIVTQLDFTTKNYARRLNSYLENEHILVFYNKQETFTLVPQLILSNYSVDLFVQQINNFFRHGINIMDRNE